MSVRLTCCALTLLFMSTCLTATAQTEYYCSSAGTKEEYFSDNFPVPRFIKRGFSPKIRAAFIEFLQKKYSLPTDNDFWNYRSTGCTFDKNAGVTKAREANRKIIETGWKFPDPIPAEQGP
jgi:hypothetical protein